MSKLKANYKKNEAKANVALIGASGFTGLETLKILLKHPKILIKALIGDKSKGKDINSIFSSMNHLDLPRITALEDVDLSSIDVIFSCMPSGILSKNVNNLPTNRLIIDLSADFRFNKREIYENFYGIHKNEKYLKKFIYGLTEINRGKIKKSSMISCPGCYPTSVLLPIIPLIKANLIEQKNLIIDSKSGISGAGRNLKEDLLFAENYSSIKAYGNGNHRHIPEMEHNIQLITKKNINITFTPHILPLNRGILSTIYVKGDAKKVFNKLRKFYEKEKFVQINEFGNLPKISDVVGTNLCRIGVIDNTKGEYTVLVSVIDNLIKGASGQAVQNMNLIMNYPEDLGLDHVSFWP